MESNEAFVQRLQRLRQRIAQDRLLSNLRHQQRMEQRGFLEDIVRGLPTVSKDQVELEDVCGICLLPFGGILEEEAAESKRREEGSKRGEEEEVEDMELQFGLAKVECGHVFCRKDLTEWTRGFHGSCPACRHVFIEIIPLAETDDESSDGGEYIPDPGEFDDEDDFTDGFSDDRDLEQEAEFAAETAELDALEEQRAMREEFAQEIALADALEEQEAEFAAETAELEALEEQRAMREEFAQEIALADALEEQEAEFALETAELEALEEQRALEDEFAHENALADALEDQEAEFAAETMEALEAQWTLEEEFAQENAIADALEEQEALEQEFASDSEYLADLEGELAADELCDDERMDYMEEDTPCEAFMDVYLSDSSSDLDYEPDDYPMSDSETEMSSDFDYSIEELACLEKHANPVTIHGGSSSDSLLAIVAEDIKIALSSRAGRAPRDEA